MIDRIKVVNNFLPDHTFKDLLQVVESEQFYWRWQNHSTPGDNKFKFGKVIFTDSSLSGEKGYVDNNLMPLFQVLVEYQIAEDTKTYNTQKLLKMKLNLYPNEGKQVQHGTHKDIYSAHIPLSPKHMTRMGEDVLDKTTLTSVFNFHTCNGYTCIGKEKIPSVANQIVIFNQTEHYGVTQSDIPRRIVFNMNVSINEKTNK